MTTFAAADLLAAWESVRSLPAAQRPAAMLRAFNKPNPASVGTREAALLELYAEHFGPRLDGLARCPQCATEVELSVPVAELVAGVPAPQPVSPLRVDGHTVHWRLPGDEDLAAVADCGSAEEGAVLLLSRCVTRVEPFSEVQDQRVFGESAAIMDPDGGVFPESAVILERAREALAERIAAADPFADITFTLACPECGAGWDSALDIAEFVWAQLRSRARRLLGEIDELARAYGWREADILGLSQDRRDSYLELVRHG